MWVLVNSHRTKEAAQVPVTHFMSPGCAARERVRAVVKAGMPVERPAAAPVAPNGVIRPSWAKSGDELFGALDAHKTLMDSIKPRVN